MGKKLYVGNLGFDVTGKDLEAVFAQAGVCESVAVITDTRPIPPNMSRTLTSRPTAVVGATSP